MSSDSPTTPEPPDDAFRKLIKSMILVILLLACGAVLLALGQCAG
jgi:hypothetical protein